MAAGLKSRIPQIILSLPDEVDDALDEVKERIASDAADRAPVQTGNLQSSIEAGDEGIYAAWYWFFPEFGTTDSPAQPYMIPAVEANMEKLKDTVEEALEDL